jgi:GNAT superfamily N-acetyltransferase
MSKSAYTLRDAVYADIDFVSAVERECMEAYARALWGEWVPSVPRYGFDTSRHRIVVVDGVDQGCIDLWEKEDGLHLNKLYLLEPARGRGIGAQLLADARLEADKIGKPLRFTVLISNPRALKFYLREGCVVLERGKERILMEHRG